MEAILWKLEKMASLAEPSDVRDCFGVLQGLDDDVFFFAGWLTAAVRNGGAVGGFHACIFRLQRPMISWIKFERPVE